MPLPVAKLDACRVVNIACSPFHTIVVTDSGELYAAGNNDEGQLVSSSDKLCIHQPHLIEHIGTQRVLSVATGASHTAVRYHVSDCC